MALVLDVTVPGRPAPLKRSRNAGDGHHYDPAENAARKALIQLHTRWSKPLLTGHLIVEVHCAYTQQNPTADVDNLAKMVLDAYNGYVWKDDVQVYELNVMKRGGCSGDGTRIIVMTEEDS